MGTACLSVAVSFFLKVCVCQCVKNLHDFWSILELIFVCFHSLVTIMPWSKLCVLCKQENGWMTGFSPYLALIGILV